MECKNAEYWISLHLDGTLDTETEKLLFEHIETCTHCNEYLVQSLEVHTLSKELLGSESIGAPPDSLQIIDAIKRENVVIKTRKSRFKPAIIAAGLVFLLLLIPINSKIVLAHVNDWVRSLIIRQPGLVMMVEDRDLASSKVTPGGKVTYTYPKVMGKYLNTPEEVLDIVYHAENKPCLPEYMPEDFEFDHAFYGKHKDQSSDDFYIESYYLKDNGPTNSRDTISVMLNYMKPGHTVSGYKLGISEDEQAKELSAADEKGILVMKTEEGGLKTYYAYFILNKQGVKLEIRYNPKKEAGNVEEDIARIAEPLLQRIKKEVPENVVKSVNVSDVIESNNEEEFFNRITSMDDRIVKPDNIPEGYAFNRGTFIDNPKEIDMLSLSSDCYITYKKENASLSIDMRLHTHTEKDSDFETSNYGEITQREALAGYVMKTYKDNMNSQGLINGRTLSVDLPDYALSLSVNSTGPMVVDKQELKRILADLVEDVKQKAKPRAILNLGRKIKLYDNLKQLSDSDEIKKNHFVLPSYLPENSDFYRAKYVDQGYILQYNKRLQASFSGKRIQPIITISMRKSDIPHSSFYTGKQETTFTKVAGQDASIITRQYEARSEKLVIKEMILDVDLHDKGFALSITQTFNGDETATDTEIIKIAESILKQMK